ncbi:MAG TPA: SDR family NAD(P)-dependent oxidoreductase [Acidimicrobiales bacterium]|nr:SDR family NAD(P)-dependent oxidoreductase [Acidimicrobiales bacterium]
MGTLTGKTALVTGASRGIGRGIAIGLGEAGATVFVTGRTMDTAAGFTGTLPETAELVTRAGGHGIPIRCDHRIDEDVEKVFSAIERDAGSLDLLVNNATAVPTDLHVLFDETPFWEVSVSLWDDLFSVGLRSHFVAARLAATLMIPHQRGLIVNISSAAAQAKFGVLPYGVSKAASDRMTADMAADLVDHGVCVVSLWPPPSRTESMLASADGSDDPSSWSSPTFTGRVIAALSAAPGLMGRTGSAFRVRDLAEQLGVPDMLGVQL